MSSHKISAETTKSPKEDKNKSSGLKKTITTASFALAAWLFSSCDKVPNDQILLDPDKESVAVSYEYQFGWAESGTLVDYNIFVHKDGDKFKWTIEQSDWFFSNTTNIESDNLDWLFEEISDKSDSEYITENTRAKKNDKLAFAKKAYKDNILNKSKKWDKSGKFKIKYKKK